MRDTKRFFGYVELVFDSVYLLLGLGLGVFLLWRGGSMALTLAGIMGLVLVVGDSFHLLPRMAVIVTGDRERYRNPLGIGKLVTSVTMTVFYGLLWWIGCLLFALPRSPLGTVVVVGLGAVRILLCLLPQNRWTTENPPVIWGVLRNIPFVLLGLVVLLLYWNNRGAIPELGSLWLAIGMSFLFYIPVVLWADRKPMVGMLMLPKTVMYLWIMSSFAALI